MKLVFYSGGSKAINKVLDEEIIKLSGKKSPQITYIPSVSYELKTYYRSWQKYFSSYGVKKFHYFGLEEDHSAADIEKAFKSDIIFLSGGNTYTFLAEMRSSTYAARFKKFIKYGGVIVGQSAGGILLTPNIGTAAVPSFDADENEDNLTDLKALNYVNFEFSPHYDGEADSDTEILEYSKQSKYPILACEDGAGVIVDGSKLSFVGNVIQFKDGMKFEISHNALRL